MPQQSEPREHCWSGARRGNGQRFGAQIPKQFVEINGRMIIEYTLENVAVSRCKILLKNRRLPRVRW